MILIVSNDKDQSTNDVLQWIREFGAEYVRINQNTRVVLRAIDISDEDVNLVLEVDSLDGQRTVLNSAEVSAYWYRRGDIFFNPRFSSKKSPVHDYLWREYLHLKDFVHELFVSSSDRSINSNIDADINKLHVLRLAQSLGIKIPVTHIRSSINDLDLLLSEDRRYITKALNRSSIVKDSSLSYGGMTESLSASDLVGMEIDFPSLVQEEIQKDYELRVFFLNKQYYASAIFSQADPKTSVDFRNYNTEKQNRVVPYVLPSELEEKLNLLFDMLELSCGSFDMVVDRRGEFVFLEVNPIGQFQQVSLPCSYYLEKKIAQYLCGY